MKRILNQISEDGGPLKKVVGMFATGIDPGESRMLQGLLMEFESSRLALLVTDEDEIVLVPRFDENRNGGEFRSENLGHVSPWREVIGASVLWAWLLTNQQGYTDGVQFEFSGTIDSNSTTVQLLALANEIRVRTLGSYIE